MSQSVNLVSMLKDKNRKQTSLICYEVAWAKLNIGKMKQQKPVREKLKTFSDF